MSFSKALTIKNFSNFEFQSYFKNLNFTKVAIAGCSGTIKVYYQNLSIKINSIAAHTFCLNRITQSPFNYNFVATASCDNKTKIWDITSNNANWVLVQTYEGHTKDVFGLEWLNEEMIATGSLDCTIQLWSIYTGTRNFTFYPSTSAWSLKLLSNGINLVAGLDNGKIEIYNINTRSLVTTLFGHTGWIANFVQITNDLLASASTDKTVRIWNLTTNTSKFILTGHNDCVQGLRLVSNDILASGSYNSTVKLWNITNGTLIRTLSNHSKRIFWSVDMLSSEVLISGSEDLTIKLWNYNTGEVLNSVNTGMSIRVLTVLKTNSKHCLFVSFK
jgi:WD40 repeat protein